MRLDFHIRTNASQITASMLFNTLNSLHCSHVVLGLQGDLQNFGATDHPLQAGRGDRLTGDPVDLVEGVWFQDPLVSCPYKHLQTQQSCASIPTKLGKGNTHTHLNVSSVSC